MVTKLWESETSVGVTYRADKAFNKHFVMCGVQDKGIQKALREQGDKMSCKQLSHVTLRGRQVSEKNGDILLLIL